MLLDCEKFELSAFINEALIRNQEINADNSNLIYKKYKKKQTNITNFNIFNVDKYINITLIDYINRIIKYLDCNIVCYIYSLIYIDKIIFKNINLCLTKYNTYKIFIVSLICSCKFIDDDIPDNKYYSKLSGIELKELNLLERIFLSQINYNLVIDDDLYNKYLQYFPESIINYLNNPLLHK